MSTIIPISGQTIDPNSLRDVISHPGATNSQKIDQAGVQFEAIFVRQFLNDALKPMVKGAMEEDGSANDTYRYFITDKLSQSLAQQGVFGLGKQISTQLKARQADSAQAVAAAGATSGKGSETAISSSRLAFVHPASSIPAVGMASANTRKE